jgi:hypothetical protein
MSQFIQSLESRVLMSASSATLSTDLSTIVADATTTRAASKSLQSTALSDERIIAADLRGLSNKSSNRVLLLKAQVDEARLFSRTAVAEANLLITGSARSRHAVGDGRILLAHPTNASLKAHVAGHVTNLNTVIPAELNVLQSDVANLVQTWVADLNAIAAANPGSSTLAAAVQTAQNDVSTHAGALTSAATKFQTDIAILGNDLLSIGS